MDWVGVVTNAGRTLINSCLASSISLIIDTVKCGTGTVQTANMRSQTNLQSYKDTGAIVEKIAMSKTVDDVTYNGVQIKLSFGPYDGGSGYTMKEIGLWGYAEGTSQSVMIALLQNSDGTDIPTLTEFPDYNLILAAFIDVSNTDTLAITVDPNAYVSQAQWATKLNINQGSANAGKFMIVDSNGDVVPTTVPFANGEDF